MMKQYRLVFLACIIIMPLLGYSQTGRIDKVWFEHNVSQNGEMGMRIHTTYSILGGKGRSIDLSVNHYFIYQNGGGPVPGNVSGYTAPGPNGKPQAAAWARNTITPPTNADTWGDWWVFVPYRVIQIYNGKHTLGVATFLMDCNRGQFIQNEIKKTWFDFTAGSQPQQTIPGYNGKGFTLENSSINGIPATMLGGNTPSGGSKSNVNGGSSSSRRCEHCHGNGRCNTCNGNYTHWIGYVGATPRKCPNCTNGTCPYCGGTGRR